jgi:hypothetical protein
MLQRQLGDLGEVLPRLEHGTPRMRAQGWYARLRDGKVHFLGDSTPIAMYEIAQIHDKNAAPTTAAS